MTTARARWLALALAVALLAGALAVWLLRPPALEAFALEAWVPADAAPVAWVDELAPVARGVRRLVERVPGAQGVREALELTAGLDLLDPDEVSRAGLRLDAGLVGYRWRGGLWLVVPVRSGAALDHVLGVLRNRGYRPQPAITALEGVAQHFTVDDRALAGREALHLWQLGSALVVRWPETLMPEPAPPVADVAAEFRAWQGAPRMPAQSLGKLPGELHARLPLSAEAPLVAALHDTLGLGNLVVGGLIDRADRLEADLHLDAAWPELRVRLRAPAGSTADVTQYHFGYLPEASEGRLDLGDLLPDETLLLARARVNPALLRTIPQALRDRLIPASLLSALHPALAGIDARQGLIEALDGQIAVGLLAIADEAPLDARAWPGLSLRRVLRGFAAVSFATDSQATAFVDRARAALEGAGTVPDAARFGTWTGFAVAGPEAPWLLLRDGRKVALVSGPGGADDLARIAAGRFPSLGKAARGALEQGLVQGSRSWLGVTATTPRAVRSLRRRGVPDHFVQMLASIAAVSAAVRLGPDGVELTLQLRPDEQGLEVQPTATAGEP